MSIEDWIIFRNKFESFSEQTFKGQSATHKLNHLQEELLEIVDDIDDIEEWADVIILFIDASRKAGIDLQDFSTEPQRHFEHEIEKSLYELRNFVDDLKRNIHDKTYWEFFWKKFWNLAASNLITEYNLFQTCYKKFEKLKKRTWHEPDEDGIIRHKKS